MYKCYRVQGKILLLIYRLHKLPYHQRHTLYPLDLFLRPHQLPLKTPAIPLGLDLRIKLVAITHLCSSLMYSSCRFMYLPMS